MVGTNNRHSSHSTLSRRAFLGATSAASIVVASGAAHSAQAGQVPDSDAPLRYAVIGDSHIMPTDESRAFYTSRLFAWLESVVPEPAFVIHIGDLTEAGFQVEYEQYAALIPEKFRDRIFHVPGNREVQWDEYGKRLFVEWYGQPPYSFDAGGVHFVALDATILLQPLGQFGGDQLTWLQEDLKRTGADVPVVLFFHYPVGGSYYYIADQDDLYAAIEPYNVIAIHAGHLHRETVRSVNGIVQATMRAAKDGPFLHLVDRQGETLALSTLEIRETGEAVVEPVATIPMHRDARSVAATTEPIVESMEADGIVRVSVPAELVPGASEVTVRPWPNHLFSTRDSDKLGWVPLVADNPAAPATWSGSISLANMSPGHDRIEMSANSDDGGNWQRAYPVAVSLENQPVIAWEQQVTSDAVHAGLVTLPGGEVIATSTDGDIAAYAVSLDGTSELWRLPGEGVHSGIVGTPVVTTDGTVVFGRVTGELQALHGMDGSARWQVPFEMPVLASITSVDTEGAEVLLVSTGGTIHALDATDGTERWANGSSMLTGGRSAFEAGLVYASFADGTLRAFALENGDEEWQVATFVSPDIYSLVAKSGWAHATGIVPARGERPGRVITSTETSATGHDLITGLIVWEVPGPYMYAAPLVLDSGMVVMGAIDGTVTCVDPVAGGINWQASVGYGVFNAAPLQYGDTVLVPGVGAQLSMLDARTGDVISRIQLGGTSLFSTPVIVGDLLVAGGQDGKIRAVHLPSIR